MEHIHAETVGQPLSLQNISALSRLERHRAPARVDLLQVDTPFHELSPRTVTAHLGAKSPSVYSWSRYDRSGVVRERGSGRLTAILQLRVHCRGAATADSEETAAGRERPVSMSRATRAEREEREAAEPACDEPPARPTGAAAGEGRC